MLHAQDFLSFHLLDPSFSNYTIYNNIKGVKTVATEDQSPKLISVLFCITVVILFNTNELQYSDNFLPKKQ